MMTLDECIVIDKEILAGEPVFKGTRVAIKTLFDHLEECDLEEFLCGFPSGSREQAEAVIKHLSANRYQNSSC